MITEIENESWQVQLDKSLQAKVLNDIEVGGVIFLPHLKFDLSNQEQKFLISECADEKSKNISFDLKSNILRGSNCEGEDLLELHTMISRFAQQSRKLVNSLFPFYKDTLQMGRTSYRPKMTEKRKSSSVRKDDSKLHIDSFASQPIQGSRLLRVFSNINPILPRVWKLGEPFENVADRFLPRISHKQWISPHLLRMLGITKTLRSDYDHLMLQIHDSMKQDADYQRTVAYTQMSFPPLSTWVVMTDKVSHAALSGQFMLEQTFYLPPHAMHDSKLSPLSILEKKLNKRLVL
jgi:hypothetical protein